LSASCVINKGTKNNNNNNIKISQHEAIETVRKSVKEMPEAPRPLLDRPSGCCGISKEVKFLPCF